MNRKPRPDGNLLYDRLSPQRFRWLNHLGSIQHSYDSLATKRDRRVGRKVGGGSGVDRGRWTVSVGEA